MPLPADILRQLISPLVAFAVSFIVLRWMLARASHLLPLDHPNDRSLHSQPIPRTGGIAILAGITGASLVLWPAAWLWVAAAVLLAAFSFVDDWRGLSVGIRFATHFLLAGLTIVLVARDLPAWQQAVAALAVVWVLNLYNFMDGSDGLAGGMAVIGFGGYGVAALITGDGDFAALCISIAAAAAAFLLFNFHPARIFMGDTGSIPLGVLAATLGFSGWQTRVWPWWFPVLVFSPFVVDASVTLARRLLRRERVWQAHRQHYYQRLVQLGWGHRKTALAEYVLMVACAASGLLARNAGMAAVTALLAFWALAYMAIMIAIDNRWANNPANETQP